MDTLKRKRTQLRRNYTALNKKFTAAVEGKTDVEAKYLVLSEAAEALFDVEDKLYEAWSESADFVEADFEADQDKALEYRESWAEARAIYNNLRPKQLSRHGSQTSVNSLTTDGSGHTNATGVRNTSLKLPRLELPKFDGETRNWIQFWGQFSKLHDDKDLHDIDKFQYLIQSTVENSPARQLVTSYPPSAENYAKAVEALKTRFARDEMLIETYVRGLLGLVWSQLKGESCGLSNLYDSLQTHLQALESLKVTKDKFAAILYPMIESALPEDLLRSWNRSRAKCDKVDDELAKLMSFLKSEVESEERISLARQGFSHDISPPTACFVTGVSKKTNDTKFSAPNCAAECIWCSKDTHSSTECSKATRMTPKERLDLAKSKKACLICLKKHLGFFT
ncbi:hypothetical protein NE865_08481 [Phthorimaea operculella]|nr:hypothetical protein NE865_08481 [Phthorimaea operculella]